MSLNVPSPPLVPPDAEGDASGRLVAGSVRRADGTAVVAVARIWEVLNQAPPGPVLAAEWDPSRPRDAGRYRP